MHTRHRPLPATILLAALVAATLPADRTLADDLAALPERRAVEAVLSEPAVRTVDDGTAGPGLAIRPPSPSPASDTSGVASRAATGLFEPVGSDATGTFPAHASIAAGPDHLLVAGDSFVGLYDKGGVPSFLVTLNTFFAPLGPAGTLLQPKVAHDPYEDRYLLTALEVAGGTARTYLGVSAGADPLGTWYVLSFSNLTLIGGVDHFADFPGFALDEEALYLSANMHELGTGAFGGVRLWILAKGAGSGGLYDGGTLSGFIIDPFATTSPALPLQPAFVHGGGTGNVGTFFLGFSSLNDGVDQYLRWVRIRRPTTSPRVRVRDLRLPAPLEDLPLVPMPDAPQAGTAALVDTGGSEVLQAVWRHPDLWAVTTIAPRTGDPDNGQATAHWLRLDTSNVNRLTLADQGPVRGEDVAASTHTFYPSLAVDADGRMTVGFSASAPTIQVGAWAAQRDSAAAAGTIGASQEVRAGDGPYEQLVGGVHAWGRWSGAALDEASGCAWLYNQYAQTPSGAGGPGTGRWGSVAGHLCPCSESTALGTGVWRLVAPACDVGADDTVADVFGDDLGVADHDVRWAVFERDEAADAYVQMALGDPVSAGNGYWVIHLDPGFGIDVEGRGNGSFDIPLTADPAGRRNMVGHPHAFDVCWSDVRVIDGASVLTLDQADPDLGGTLACDMVPPDPSCVMSRVAYKWNGAAYEPFDGVTAGALGTLRSLDGFWVTASKPGIALRVPATTSSCGVPAPPPGVDPDDPAPWFVRLAVSSGEARDAGNVFGQLPGAAAGPDVHDLEEPAPFAADYLTLVFPHPEWGERAGDYATDFHPVGRGGRDAWTFEVRSGVPGRTVTLEWQAPPAVLERSLLLDPDSRRPLTDLRHAESFTFTLEGDRRTLRWQLLDR